MLSAALRSSLALTALFVVMVRCAAQGPPAPDRVQADRIREHIEEVTRETLAKRGEPMVVKSRYRDDSEAHKRGAIDISSKDLKPDVRHDQAREISKNLGKEYDVIVEENHDYHKKTKTTITYRDGIKGNTREVAITRNDEGIHTHIQPIKPKAVSGPTAGPSQQKPVQTPSAQTTRSGLGGVLVNPVPKKEDKPLEAGRADKILEKRPDGKSVKWPIKLPNESQNEKDK